MTLAERRQQRDLIFGATIALLAPKYDFYFRARNDPNARIMNPCSGNELMWNNYERRGIAQINDSTTVELERDLRADVIKVTCIHRIGDTEDYEIVSMDCENTSALFISEVVKMFVRQVL